MELYSVWEFVRWPLPYSTTSEYDLPLQCLPFRLGGTLALLSQIDQLLWCRKDRCLRSASSTPDLPLTLSKSRLPFSPGAGVGLGCAPKVAMGSELNWSWCEPRRWSWSWLYLEVGVSVG